MTAELHFAVSQFLYQKSELCDRYDWDAYLELYDEDEAKLDLSCRQHLSQILLYFFSCTVIGFYSSNRNKTKKKTQLCVHIWLTEDKSGPAVCPISQTIPNDSCLLVWVFLHCPLYQG